MASTNFNTSNDTLRKLLGNGLVYRVPPFQRDYSWDEDHWDDLWQDIMGLFEEDGDTDHYMGYLVLQSSDNKRFDIIDGQQRLTTLSVMILAGLSYLESLAGKGLDAEKNRARKEQLQNSYIGYLDPVTLEPESKLELNRHNNNYYQTYLVPLEKLPQRGLKASEHLLRKAFNNFNEHIKQKFGASEDSGQRFVEMLNSLVDKLFFTVITVTDELNAFKVFETLNARGVRLSSTDLLKNYLFSLLSSATTHATQLQRLEERWERIVDLLEGEKFPEYLRVFWNSRNRLVRKSELFKRIRQQITTQQQAAQLLRDLDSGAEVYTALRDAQDRRWLPDERDALEQLQMFNVRQPLAMLMACYETFFETQRPVFTRILKAIAVLSLRYNVICSRPANEQEQLYSKVASSVSGGHFDSLQQVLDMLVTIYPGDNSFKTAFADKELRTTNSRNRKIVRYMLFKLEKHRTGIDLDRYSDSYNIEHILPEQPSDAWDYIEEARQSRLTYRLGNMTLMEVGPNRDIGNEGYSFKRPAYEKSTFRLTRAVAENNESWDEQRIVSRQAQLAKLAVAVWRTDF